MGESAGRVYWLTCMLHLADTGVEDLDSETVGRLPGALEEAISALESNKTIRDSIGASLVTATLAVRKAEATFYKDKPEAKELLIARY